MTKLLHTIERDCQVWIYDGVAVAKIYEDRTVATIPYVRWVGDTGGYAEGKHRIDGSAHEKIKRCMEDECEDTAWEIIYGNV